MQCIWNYVLPLKLGAIGDTSYTKIRISIFNDKIWKVWELSRCEVFMHITNLVTNFHYSPVSSIFFSLYEFPHRRQKQVNPYLNLVFALGQPTGAWGSCAVLHCPSIWPPGNISSWFANTRFQWWQGLWSTIPMQ